MNMSTGTAQVAYKKGEVYLIDRYGAGLTEVTILDISKSAKAIKTDTDGWMTGERFHDMVAGKIGHIEMQGFFIFKRRVVVRET
jgi:hypothetical protein